MAETNPRWTAADLPDLTGRTMLITGANSGLGLESARALARHGAQVLMAGRNPQKLSEAAATVTAGPQPVTVRLDLADLGSVRRAASEVLDLTDRLDVLMNNAGVMAPPLRRTKDGFESQIGTNHLGHYALTGLLLPLLADARVVTVSSGAHNFGSVDVSDLNYEHRSYSSWPAYGQSKLANLLFTSELDRRARAAGWDGLVAVAAHPGYAATNLQTSGPWYAQNPVGRLGSRAMNLLLGQSAEAGAWPQLYAAAGPDVHGDDYFGPTGLRGMRGHPGPSPRSSAARDEQVAGALWEVSQSLTGVVYDWSRPTGEHLS